MACNLCFKNFCRGFAYMNLILIYQMMSFAVCLFLSLVMAIFLAFSFEFCWGYTLPTFIICFIQACLLITAVQLHTVFHDGTVGLNMVEQIREFPIFLNMIPVIFTCILSFGAYYQIFTEYYNIHLLPSEFGSNASAEMMSTEKPTPRNFQTNGNEYGSYVDNTVALLLARYGRSFIIFIVCFSYLIYTMAKVIQKDTSIQLRGGQYRLGKFSSLVILFSLLCQAALTFGYSIPMVYAAIFARWLHSSHRAAFFYISAISAVIGIGASFLETNDPFPTIKNLGPFFFFECQIKARLMLLKYGILPFVYYWFLNFYSSIYIPFNATIEERRFLYFVMTFAILVLHSIKIVSYGMLMSRHPLYAFRRRRRRRPHHIDPDEQDPPRVIDRGVGPAQAVANPIRNPDLVDPTLRQVNNGQNNNNNLEDELTQAQETADNQGQHSGTTLASSSHGRRKRRKGRNLTGKWPWAQNGPNSTMPDLEDLESFMDEVWAQVAVEVSHPDEPQPGPSTDPRWSLPNQSVLPNGPMTINEDVTDNTIPNEDRVPDSNNNDVV